MGVSDLVDQVRKITGKPLGSPRCATRTRYHTPAIHSKGSVTSQMETLLSGLGHGVFPFMDPALPEGCPFVG